MPPVDTVRHLNPTLAVPLYPPPLLNAPPTAGGVNPQQGLTPPPSDLKGRTISRGTAWELVAPKWRRHGKDQVDIALAVIEAESGFQTKVVSYTGCCVGIWQINLAANHVTRACAESPICATNVAYRLWKDAKKRGGTGWEPWEAYTNGSYKKFLGKTTIQDASAVEEGFTLSGPDCGIIPDPVCHVIQGFGVIFDRDFWVRILKILAGLVAVGMAVMMIAREYSPVGQLLKGAT